MQWVTLNCALHVPFQCMLRTRVKLFILHLHEVEVNCTLRLRLH
jgi:hypothetical protein